MDLETWKRHLIEVLKDSPSKERKFLRWKVTEVPNFTYPHHDVVVEVGELEVLPETFL